MLKVLDSKDRILSRCQSNLVGRIPIPLDLKISPSMYLGINRYDLSETSIQYLCLLFCSGLAKVGRPYGGGGGSGEVMTHIGRFSLGGQGGQFFMMQSEKPYLWPKFN